MRDSSATIRTEQPANSTAGDSSVAEGLAMALLGFYGSRAFILSDGVFRGIEQAAHDALVRAGCIPDRPLIKAKLIAPTEIAQSQTGCQNADETR